MYLELDEGYPGHRKTLRLCALLENPEADVYPPRLWAWAVRSAPEGELTGMTPFEIETAVRYRPLDGRLYAALVKAGFIDEDGNDRAIHDWMEHTGGAIRRMSDKADRKRTFRTHHAGKCAPDTCPHCRETRQSRDRGRDSLGTGVGTVPGRGLDRLGTVPTQTSPVQTSPDKTRDPDPSRDPTDRGPEHVAPSPVLAASLPVAPPAGNENGIGDPPPPSKLSGYDLQRMFGKQHAETFGGLPWDIPPDTRGKASAFAESLTPESAADVAATMRLFCEHVEAQDEGWDEPRQRDNIAFAFGSWLSRHTELRNELHGKQPAKRAAQEHFSRPRWTGPVGGDAQPLEVKPLPPRPTPQPSRPRLMKP